MLQVIYSAGLNGVDGFLVTVECNCSNRMEKFDVVGLPDAAVKEARERIKAAIADYEPSTVTRYILDLSAAFNRFYHDCKIAACEDEKQRSSRLALTNATSQVLKTALGLICMQAPEKI